ncbi:MAG: clostripain-related cysteine peptidase [bacterium]
MQINNSIDNRNKILEKIKDLINNKPNTEILNNINNLPQEEKDWTVFVNINLEDELSVKNALMNLKLLELSGSDKNLNIVVQAYLPTWKKVKRFYIEKKGEWNIENIIKISLKNLLPFYTPKLENKPIQELENVNPNDPNFIAESLKWVTSNFPSKKFMVIDINDSKDLSTFRVSNISKALSDNKINKKPDILIMGGSNITSLENITQLKDKATYLIGTTGFSNALNIPFAMFINEMKNLIDGGPNDPETIAKGYFLIHNLAGASNNSAIVNLTNDKIQDLIKAYDNLALKLLNLPEQELIDKILPKIYKTEDLANTPFRKPYLEFRDSISFLNNLINSNDINDDIKQAAKETLEKTNNILLSFNNLATEIDPNSQGPSVFMPINLGNFKSDKFPIPKDFKKDLGYSNTEFAKQTHWDEFLYKISQKTLLEKFLTKLGFSQQFIDNLYAFKNDVNNKYNSYIKPFTSLISWFNAVSKISSNKVPSFLFLPPIVTLTLGVIGSIDQIYNNLKEGQYILSNDIKDKSKYLSSVGFGLSQGVTKLIANLAYVLPFLGPVGTTAGLLTFLIPWIQDFYNVYQNYKEVKDKFVYNDLTLKDLFLLSLYRKTLSPNPA